jgi:hypothetical protein
MIKQCMKAALVAAAMMGATMAKADDARPVEMAAVDRTLTFAIPSHAIASYIATLNEASDFTVFVHQDCPADLQRLALRRLWRMLPQDAADNATN